MDIFTIKTPKFDFDKFIYFHGWIYLRPFAFHENERTIERHLRLENNNNIKVKITACEKGSSVFLKITSPIKKKLSDKNKGALTAQTERMFCLDQDYSRFYEMCRQIPFLAFVYKNKCKGLLRSPSSYEDIIKTICTTNCDWKNTKKMCDALCQLGDGNFPTPKEILKYNENTLSKLVPLGYRARTVLEVTRQIEEGIFNLDDWGKQKDFARIRNSLKSIWGIGDYSVNHISVLLGDYSCIPVDGEVLKYLREIYFKGKPVSKKEAVSPFEEYNEYKYLVYKYERMAKKLNYINKL